MKLEEVITVEREIAENAGAERAKATRWLAETKRAIDDEAARQTARLKELAIRNNELAKQRAEATAAAIVDDANALAATLTALDDDRLRALLRKQLVRIVPRPLP